MSKKQLFNDNWRFHRGEITTAAPHFKGASYMQAKTERMLLGPAAFAYNDRPEDYRMSALYTDEKWENVTLPHDYVILQTPSPEHNMGLGYFLYENAWYRKHFVLNEDDRDKRIAIRFGSVTTACEIFCNGAKVAENKTGNTPFEVDITDFVWFERENVLAVHVITDRHESWWYEGGGICRDVWIVRSSPVYIAENGIYVKYEKIDEKLWRVLVETEVKNDTREKNYVSVETDVIDKNGNIALKTKAEACVQPFDTSVCIAEGDLVDPMLWDIETPNLYTVCSRIIVGDKLCDEEYCRTGFRTFEATKDGFYLNGRKVFIFGVNGHEDAGLFGHAIPSNLPGYKLSMLKEMGCNGYRCSHYMQSDAMMDATDEMGFIVMAETRWYDSSPEGIRQLETLVKRDRNRPSVFFWSLGNEEPRHRNGLGVRMLRRMAAAVRRLDNTRPIASAFCAKAKDAPVMNEVDVIGINYNLDDYDSCRELYPDKPIIGTETCATSTTRGWYRDTCPERGYYSAYDKDTTELFVSREKTMKFFASRNDVMGFYQWDGFEHRGETVWPRLCSQAGAIDLFLQRKDAFYQNKSHFSKEPMLWVLPHWNLPFSEETPVRVVAYTNCNGAECFVNGVSVGRVDVEPYSVVDWTVPYSADKEICVVAYNGETVVDKKYIKRTGMPVSLELTVELPVKKANGRDVVLLNCRALDSEGNVVPDACPTVSFSANELGRVVATGSDVCDHLRVDSPIRKMREGVISVAVKVGTAPGALRIYAEAEGLKGTCATIVLE